MKSLSFDHLTGKELGELLAANRARGRETRALLLVHLADVDARQLYRSAGYRSMYGYCVGHLHQDEDELTVLLETARTAHRFPAIFEAIADGSLNEESVCLLAPCLAPDTADELLAAATHKTPEEIEVLLAVRFPDLDRRGRLRAVAPAWDTGIQAARDAYAADPMTCDLPLPPRWYELRVVVGPETRDKLLQTKAVLGYEVPPGDLAGALDRVLSAFLEGHA
jgi:hypothetical protein